MFKNGVRKKNKKMKIVLENIKKSDLFELNLEEIKQNIEKKKSKQKNGLEIKQSPIIKNDKLFIELAKNKKIEKETELTNSFISEKNIEKLTKDLLGKKREKNEIGMHAIRGGTVAGEHAVCYFGPMERIELRHSAEDRSVFAIGALRAARFLQSKAPGMYNMDDMLNFSE